MYTLSSLVKGINHPRLAMRHLNGLYHSRLGRRGYYPGGTDIMEEDWDNLIILDACRYDIFAQHNSLEGRLESRISRGSSSPEFLRGNFHDRTAYDTVYVSANPFLEIHDYNDTFHRLVKVWEEEGWDDEYGTVLPETMERYGRKAMERYDDKRLILHFMQPHYPFLTESKSLERHYTVPGTGIWEEAIMGDLELDRADLLELYEENLKQVLPTVNNLIEDLGGKTVVTADHGNFFGERSFPIPIREWGHPGRHHLEPVLKVPWLVIESAERRDIVAEPPGEERDAVDEAAVKQKLVDLGYAVE